MPDRSSSICTRSTCTIFRKSVNPIADLFWTQELQLCGGSLSTGILTCQNLPQVFWSQIGPLCFIVLVYVQSVSCLRLCLFNLQILTPHLGLWKVWCSHKFRFSSTTLYYMHGTPYVMNHGYLTLTMNRSRTMLLCMSSIVAVTDSQISPSSLSCCPTLIDEVCCITSPVTIFFLC